jgi:hypothetical protein
MGDVEKRDYEQLESTSALETQKEKLQPNNPEITTLEEAFSAKENSANEKMIQFTKTLLAVHVPDITQDFLKWLNKNNGKKEIANLIEQEEEIREILIEDMINECIKESGSIHSAFKEQLTRDDSAFKGQLTRDDSVFKEQQTRNDFEEKEQLTRIKSEKITTITENEVNENQEGLKKQEEELGTEQNNDKDRSLDKKQLDKDYEHFSSVFLEEKDNHPDLIPDTKTIQQTRAKLQNTERWSNRKSAGVDDKVLDDYLS